MEICELTDSLIVDMEIGELSDSSIVAMKRGELSDSSIVDVLGKVHNVLPAGERDDLGKQIMEELEQKDEEEEEYISCN